MVVTKSWRVASRGYTHALGGLGKSPWAHTAGPVMPTLLAGVAGSLVGSVVQSWVRPYVGVRISAAIALGIAVAVFWATRRWLTQLRNGE